jgi:TRAP-type mannitol/chloroaromatic compound transport system substrate-binding protein
MLFLEAKNATALDEMVTKDGVKVSQLPADVIKQLREVSNDTLAQAAAKDPIVKKVHESYFAFKKKHDGWNQISETTFQTTVR